MRLDKFLANSGCGSRSDVRKSISRGLVTVNSIVVRDAGLSLQDDDIVTYMGRAIGRRANSFLYFVLDKPDGVLTAMEDARYECVGDYIPSALRGKKLAPVGRLDFHTTGLLIITNDGELSHRLTSPRYNISKRYRVTYTGAPLTDKEVLEAKEGITLTDMDEPIKLKPAELKLIDDSTCELVLTEGKTHQVRRMIAHWNRSVELLHREAVGPICLSELHAFREGQKEMQELEANANAKGQLFELSEEQVVALRELCGLN